MIVCITKSMGFSKSGIKRKVYSNTNLLQETRKISNNLTLNLSEKTEGKALTLVALISVSYCLPFSLLGHSNTLI